MHSTPLKGTPHISLATEEAVTRFVYQSLGTILDKITLTAREDRLRIEILKGNYWWFEVTDHLTLRLGNGYCANLGSDYIELFESPERAAANGRPSSSPTPF